MSEDYKEGSAIYPKDWMISREEAEELAEIDDEMRERVRKVLREKKKT